MKLELKIFLSFMKNFIEIQFQFHEIFASFFRIIQYAYKLVSIYTFDSFGDANLTFADDVESIAMSALSNNIIAFLIDRLKGKFREMKNQSINSDQVFE